MLHLIKKAGSARAVVAPRLPIAPRASCIVYHRHVKARAVENNRYMVVAAGVS